MKTLFLLPAFIFLQPAKINKTYDLAIIRAKVFDVKKGVVLNDRTILINADTIAGIVGNNKFIKAKKTIDAQGKLVTPGIIDTHVHPIHFFGGYNYIAPKYLPEDSLGFLRTKFSNCYLPYGVTAVMAMGQPETWLNPILEWSAKPSSNYTDVYTVGGALVSKRDKAPFITHVMVASPLAAQQKVMEYYNMGIRHIKLYHYLRKPEFEAAFKTADSLGMRIYGHIDGGIMFMDTTLMIGLRNYEHLNTVVFSLPFSEADEKQFDEWMEKFYGKDKYQSLSFFEITMNAVRWSVDNQSPALDSLINNLAKNHATFSTTIHLFAEKLGLAYFSNPGNMPDTGLSKERKQRDADNFKAFMGMAKKMYDKGIKIRIGTDCPNGGKSALSEQLLLYQYGFPIAAIIQISTINGATALGMENKYGSIEKGKKADLIIYSKNPFDNYQNFLSSRTIIKDGVVFNNSLHK
ncbi:MAG TPA: amidohydrolase family protein [Mucilaginibacter sp.]|jgi:hypothetical protein